jgi:hypothetical protein
MRTVIFGIIAVVFLVLYLVRRRGRMRSED